MHRETKNWKWAPNEGAISSKKEALKCGSVRTWVAVWAVEGFDFSLIFPSNLCLTSSPTRLVAVSTTVGWHFSVMPTPSQNAKTHLIPQVYSKTREKKKKWSRFLNSFPSHTLCIVQQNHAMKTFWTNQKTHSQTELQAKEKSVKLICTFGPPKKKKELFPAISNIFH